MPERKANKIVPFMQGAEFYFAKYRRKLEQGKYIDALCALRAACDKKPEDQEYALELAELYTEMDFYEESNYILLKLFPENPARQEECLYGMGCKFFGLQDIDRARECFEKVLHYYPEGSYGEDAADFLEYLEEEQQAGGILPSAAFTEAEKGRKCLDSGETDQAIEIFSRLTENYPEQVFLKNNLALGLYCAGETEKAIALSRQILMQDRYSPHAICNLLLFANGAGKKELVETYRPLLEKADCREADDELKVALTYCELGEEAKAYPFFLRALEELPYDAQALYLTAACAQNLGKYTEAMQYFAEILRLWPQNTVASYYRQEMQHCREMGKILKIPYTCQVPEEEIERRLVYLNARFMLPDEKLRELWQQDTAFSRLLLWGLEAGGVAARKMIVSVLTRIGDARAEDIMRRLLLKREESDETKNMLCFALHYIGAKQPYIAYISGKMTEVRLGAVEPSQEKVPDSYDEILRQLLEVLTALQQKKMLPQAVGLFSEYLKAHSKPPALRNCKAWAGALAVLTLREAGVPVQPEQVAELLGIQVRSINRCMGLIRKKRAEKS